jgi:hypothetical protein
MPSRAHNVISRKHLTATFSNRPLYETHCKVNPFTPNDLQRRRAVSALKIKIRSKNMREKPTNATIIHSGY